MTKYKILNDEKNVLTVEVKDYKDTIEEKTEIGGFCMEDVQLYVNSYGYPSNSFNIQYILEGDKLLKVTNGLQTFRFSSHFNHGTNTKQTGRIEFEHGNMFTIQVLDFSTKETLVNEKEVKKILDVQKDLESEFDEFQIPILPSREKLQTLSKLNEDSLQKIQLMLNLVPDCAILKEMKAKCIYTRDVCEQWEPWTKLEKLMAGNDLRKMLQSLNHSILFVEDV